MVALARLIDGKAVAASLREGVRARARAFAEATGGAAPQLVIVLASDDPASAGFVGSKLKAAAEVGLRASERRLPSGTPRDALLACIRALNADGAVDGILVQLPLPPQHDASEVLAAIDPRKDVDGLHPENAGRLAQGDERSLVPCTPRGCILLLDAAGAVLAGARAVVVGRSRLVGRPTAQLLTNRHATVTLCHSRTRDLEALVRTADVLVSAAGVAELIKGRSIKPGAIVIDVGLNRTADGKLCGDVAFAAARERAAAITPVPGGVGPMTVACLLENTLIAAERRRGSLE